MGEIFRKVVYGSDRKYWYLFGRMIAKKNGECFYLLKRQKDGEYTPDHWYVGWHSWQFDISYEECGYDSGNAELNISILGWHSVFKLPWKSKRFPHGDCDAPKWGVAIHDNTFWLYKGGDGNWGGGTKWWTWDIPFFTKIHMVHLVETKDGKMVDSNTLGQDKSYISYYDDERVNKHYTKYIDSYDGSEIDCEYWKESREWRPKWLTWTKLFADKHEYIEINFKQEVGPGKGSWKGGVMGCSYNLLPGETPEECIRRMERERKF